MARHGIRHLPVVDDGRLIGVVTERDLFALQRTSMREVRRTIARSDGVPALEGAARDIRRLANDMLRQGVAACQLTQIISTLNDALTRRLIKLEVDRHGIQQLDWCWLALGSEGRYEQTFATDQDNGLIFEDGRGGAESIRRRLLPFARSVNDGLDACGFPLCRGGIMAGNPRWCLSLGEWQEKFTGWIGAPQPEALLMAAIFFDFRPVYGRDSLAEALRERLFELTRNNGRFLRRPPTLAHDDAAALAAYRAQAQPDLNAALAAQRVVVVDVESSGLDPVHDRLISVAGIVVRGGLVRLDESLEAVLRQEQASDDRNILVHGIGGSAQVGGRDPAGVLCGFLAFTGKDPLIAFHADFDRILIERATASVLRMKPENTWLDLALLAPALFPDRAQAARVLDDWLGVFGIENHARHDALATAQLLLAALAAAERAGLPAWADLARLQKDQRWLAAAGRGV